MTTASRIVDEWFGEVWNRGNVAAIERLASPNTRYYGLTEGPLDGLEAFKTFHRAFRGAFPDITVTVERTVAQDDFVVAYCHVSGTHTGPELGIEPTHRRIAFHGFGMARVVDGRVVESWNCFDFLSLYRQLGVSPAADARAASAGR
jgi:predicted ester cyclase